MCCSGLLGANRCSQNSVFGLLLRVYCTCNKQQAETPLELLITGATATQVKPLLKKHGFEITHRGQNKQNPPAPGELSDWYPIENVNADRKRALRGKLNASKFWQNGVRHPRMGHGVSGPCRASALLASRTKKNRSKTCNAFTLHIETL